MNTKQVDEKSPLAKVFLLLPRLIYVQTLDALFLTNIIEEDSYSAKTAYGLIRN